VARFVGRHGIKNVARLDLISAVTPFWRRSPIARMNTVGTE
jgi:hypothetical protein